MQVPAKKRLDLLSSILRKSPIGSQEELQEILTKKGFATTQSSISRDLKRLGAEKVDGSYRLPPLAMELETSNRTERLEAFPAGDHLIVLKTGPGSASKIALEIDKANIPTVLGTIAGDDTIFVALGSQRDHAATLRQIFRLF